MKRNAVLVALAYPEEMVAMPPAWYKKPLEWIGMVRNDRICAGHAALVLIHKETGILEYADFGRYITPMGKGRARTIHTDPECYFDIQAEFNGKGKITNTLEIIKEIEKHPEKTHGAGRLYASFCYDVNYENAKKFIIETNLRGSITYDPFKKKASNCARFVYDAFKNSIISKSGTTRLALANFITPSPLGIVFYSTDEKEVISVLDGHVKKFKGWKYGNVVKHLFHQPTEAFEHEDDKPTIPRDYKFLSGIGDQAWFHMSRPNGKLLVRKISKADVRSFEREFEISNNEFDINQEFNIVHDCNALWCTLIQNEKEYKFFHPEYFKIIENISESSSVVY